MKVNVKKLLSMILVLTMIVGMIPAVSAEGDVTEVSTSADFVTAMANGGNIKLTDSFTLSAKATVPAGKTVVLDLNGKTITSTAANNNFIEVATGGNLTIKDSKGGGGISASCTDGSGRCIRNTGTLTIESGNYTINSSSQHVYTVYSVGGTMTINGGTLTAKINGTNSGKSAHVVCCQDGATVTVNGGQFQATSKSANTSSRVSALYVETGAPNVTVNGGEFTSTRESGSAQVSFVRVKGSPTVAIKGGSFVVNGSNVIAVDKSSTASVSIAGGVFTANDAAMDVSGYLATGYEQKADGTVGAIEAVTVTEVDSSEDLLAALQAGGEIRLTGSFSLTALAEVPAGRTVVLDLNGFTISSADGVNHYLDNKGTLTILDSSTGKTGTIEATCDNTSNKSSVKCVHSTGNLYIEGGNFDVDIAYGYAYAIYLEGGSAEISGGTFNSVLNNTKSAYQACSVRANSTTELTITGGTFTAFCNSSQGSSKAAPLLLSHNVNVTIKGGNFTGTRTDGATDIASAIRCNGGSSFTIVIEGGNFAASGTNQILFESGSSNVKMEIKGGNFTCDGALVALGTTTVTGGTYKTSAGATFDVSAYIADDYYQLDDGAVVDSSKVPDSVKIGETKYKSLKDALENSTQGQTVTLLTNVKNQTVITVPEGVILNLNGYVLEASGLIADGGQIVDGLQSGLLKVDPLKLTWNPNNDQLPVWDASEGGYRMASTQIQLKAAGNGVFYFRFDLKNAQWEQLLTENEISLLVRVDGYSETYAVPAQWLTALYNDTTGKGAIKVSFQGATTNLDISVSVASGAVEITKATNGTDVELMGPTGTVDPLAGGVREYLNNASARYDSATATQLENIGTVKAKERTSLYKMLQPVTFTWRLENKNLVSANSQVTIQLSKNTDFSTYETVICQNFNPNVTQQSEPVWNLMTATTYYWRLAVDGKVISETGTFTTEKGPGMLYTDGIFGSIGAYNMRDLGGWVVAYDVVLSDGTVLAKAGDITTHGNVFRSAKLEAVTANDVDLILNKLGIRTEIDLRPVSASSESERAKTSQLLQDTGRWTYVRSQNGNTAQAYANFINNPSVATEYLRVFTDPANYPIVFHCAGGADRTGSLALILGALQGMSEADLVKDYELTTYRFVDGVQDGSYRDFPALLKAFHALEGDTPYEKARNFCLSAGLTNSEIDCIIQYMNGNLDYKP